MELIGEYFADISRITVEQYLATEPPAVFLHHLAAAPMKPTEGSPSETMYRLAVGDTPPPFPSEEVVKEKAFAVYPIAGEPGQRRFLIGCGLFCDIFINDVSVSRDHAWIERRGDSYVISDNNSTSGTWVQRRMIKPGAEQLLENADEVVIGGVDLIFLLPRDFYHFSAKFLGSNG